MDLMTCDLSIEEGLLCLTAFRVNAVPGFVYVLATVEYGLPKTRTKWEHCLPERVWMNALSVWVSALRD